MSLQGTGATALSNYIKGTLIPNVVDIRSSNIFDNEVTDLQGFPAATITLEELPGKVLDNSRNQHIFRFVIRIFIDRNVQNFGTSKAESILRSTTNDLITQIDADPTLNGNCIIASVFSVKFGYLQRESNNIRVAEVTLNCIDANTWR